MNESAGEGFSWHYDNNKMRRNEVVINDVLFLIRSRRVIKGI